MKQVLLAGPKEFVVHDTSVPEIKENEVLIKVGYIGICGSDMHTYYGKHPFVPLPVILGHEFSGVVKSIGSAVTHVHVGDRVAVDPTITCGSCKNCKRGRANVCNHLKLIGCHKDTVGAFGEYVVAPASNVHVIPAHTKLTEAAFVEPLAVGVHACRRGQLDEGQTVCIVGSGTIGLMTAFAAKYLGASRVVIMDISEEKCTTAASYGFEVICNRSKNPKALVTELFGESGPDVMFECVGVEGSIRFCTEGSPKGGRIVVVGVYEEEIRFPMAFVQEWELELIGTLTYSRQDFKDALKLIVDKKVDVEKLISRKFPLIEAADAFHYIEENRSTVVKVLLDPTLKV